MNRLTKWNNFTPNNLIHKRRRGDLHTFVGHLLFYENNRLKEATS